MGREVVLHMHPHAHAKYNTIHHFARKNTYWVLLQVHLPVVEVRFQFSVDNMEDFLFCFFACCKEYGATWLRVFVGITVLGVPDTSLCGTPTSTKRAAARRGRRRRSVLEDP